MPGSAHCASPCEVGGALTPVGRMSLQGSQTMKEVPLPAGMRHFFMETAVQALGRLPWFADFLRRERRLRPVLPMAFSS